MPRKKRSDSQQAAAPAPAPRPAVAAHIRDRQRQVAEREAARLARPEALPKRSLAHADRKKSAVSSTPFGVATRKSEDSNSHLSSSTWCGPFAVAREMIAQREQAKRLREEEAEAENNNNSSHPLDAIMQQVEFEQQRKIHPSLQWKSRVADNAVDAVGCTKQNESIYAKRQKRVDVSANGSKNRVPTLFQLVIDFVVDNFDDVEALGQVDHSIRTAIMHKLVAENKLNPQSFNALLDPEMEALELIDCSQLPQDVVTKSLQELVLSLRYLILDQCGRCFGHKAVQALNNNNLLALSIGGAYLLKDTDAAHLLDNSPMATSFEFKACPLLGLEFCKALASRNKTSLVELSLEDLTLDENSLQVLVSSTSPDNASLASLKSLSLRRIEALNDDLVAKLLENISLRQLQVLDLSHNYNLTDATLATIRKLASGVRSLSLNGLKHLTSQGLEALFMHVPGMEAPPLLHSLELANLDHGAVTDDVVNLATQAASKQSDGDKGLVRLVVQGSTAITSTSCEYLVKTSSHTLQTLDISFCPSVTDQGLGYLVQHCRSLHNLDIWGCAQITDLFLDGHDRVQDPALEISGAWIKKNSTCTIR